jgi:hypothetical protein
VAWQAWAQALLGRPSPACVARRGTECSLERGQAQLGAASTRAELAWHAAMARPAVAFQGSDSDAVFTGMLAEAPRMPGQARSPEGPPGTAGDERGGSHQRAKVLR